MADKRPALNRDKTLQNQREWKDQDDASHNVDTRLYKLVRSLARDAAEKDFSSRSGMYLDTIVEKKP